MKVLCLFTFSCLFKNKDFRSTWVAQLVMGLTLGFGSGHDLMVLEFKPCIGLCADSVESAWDSQSQIGRASCRERVCLYV